MYRHNNSRASGDSAGYFRKQQWRHRHRCRSQARLTAAYQAVEGFLARHRHQLALRLGDEAREYELRGSILGLTTKLLTDQRQPDDSPIAWPPASRSAPACRWSGREASCNSEPRRRILLSSRAMTGRLARLRVSRSNLPQVRTIGLGYRSQLTHDLDGHFKTDLAGTGDVDADGTVNLIFPTS